ncbi:unnamed protein product [Coffea canephora]|uniref:BHLH domain-containing protein n=2 Tax=Coffea TaxID=13442 RepID=A0A068V0E3_COFCA|nr:transcription factor bHLH51-like [Coffea arabica]XP_027110762.1 transcription factor bHLH51-like [Coffea arabica]CDP13989.1 unnamed protein product [Coffea canephora]
MANCFSSADLQEDAAWKVCHQAAVEQNSMDLPFLAPQLNNNSTPDEASSFNFDGYPFSLHPWSIPAEGFAEGRAASASRSHSEAEKRRRDRINAQLATLRKLIPKSEKMDKAALLGSVVEHVKEMKSKTTEISNCMMIPTDVDEVTVDYVDDEYCSSIAKDRKILLKACVCCDDRPEFFSELNRALKSLRLTTVEANVISLGGRIKSSFILCPISSSVEGGICGNTLKQSLKLVLSRIAASCTTSTGSNYRIKSRRQRFFLPSH